jgi:hypothetical protein
MFRAFLVFYEMRLAGSLDSKPFALPVLGLVPVFEVIERDH